MNRPRSFEQRLEAWLEEGPASAPPDLLDQVLDSVPLTNPPRRRVGAARRLPLLSSLAKFGAAVAAVLVIGVVGVSLLNSRNAGIGTASPTPTAVTTDLPTGALASNLCTPAVLAARITSWEGAAGHRIANVELKNTGAEQCVTESVDRPQLVGGDGTVLIEGVAATTPHVLTLATGQTVKTLVQDGNYCGANPVAPVTVAFVLSSGAGRVVATPVTLTDIEGIPPCNSTPGSAGSVEMQPWAP